MRFIHPVYWHLWILYGFLCVVSWLPYRFQVAFGRRLGRLLAHVYGKRRKIAETNLRLCFPDWPEEKRRDVLEKHFESLGMCLFEFGMSWWWPDERMRPLAHIEGLENLHEALKKNRGVILLAGHFTTLEIISRVLKLHADFHPMYRRNNNEFLDHVIRAGREWHCGKVIPHDDLRSMIRSLRGNMPVLYIPDQNFGRKQSIFVPFFGIPTATAPATSRISALFGTPIVPIVQRRLPGSKGYRLVIEKALENFPTLDVEQDTIRINRLIEKQIRDNPADYLWVHRRFKTRPEGEAPVYDDSD